MVKSKSREINWKQFTDETGNEMKVNETGNKMKIKNAKDLIGYNLKIQEQDCKKKKGWNKANPKFRD